MTVRVRGLMVDDDPTLASMVMRGVSIGFRKIDWDVDWTTADSATGAHEMIGAERPFDLAIVDYQLELQNVGLSVVNKLRAQTPHCYILVVSGASDLHPDFDKQAIRHGASEAIVRGLLTLNPPANADHDSCDFDTLARRIRQRLQADDPAGEPAITFADSAEVQSMLYGLGDPPGADRDAGVRGRRIARFLILQCLESDDDSAATLRVEHLAQGRSGAHICKVLREQDGRPQQSFVVKMSLNRAALEAELRATENAATVLDPQALVNYSGNLRKDSGSGYAALVARLVDDAVTLKSWLPTAGAGPAKLVARELFHVHLAKLFQPSLRYPHKTITWLELSPARRLRIHGAVTKYTKIWEHPQGAGVGDAERFAAALLAFSDDGVLPGENVPPMDGSVTYVDGFGDLHATNILVRTAGQPWPVLIDASDYGQQHWAGDAARLLVDLVLQVRRSTVGSMLWTSVAADAAYAGALCDCTDDGGGDPDDPVDAFIHEVVTEREPYLRLRDLQLRRTAWHWQWHVAMAREFLRQGSRESLAPPTAVLAMAAAARHLERAVDALRV